MITKFYWEGQILKKNFLQIHLQIQIKLALHILAFENIIINIYFFRKLYFFILRCPFTQYSISFYFIIHFLCDTYICIGIYRKRFTNTWIYKRVPIFEFLLKYRGYIKLHFPSSLKKEDIFSKTQIRMLLKWKLCIKRNVL